LLDSLLQEFQIIFANRAMGNIISYFFPQPQPAPASIEDASQNNVAAAVPQFVVENQKSELIFENEKGKAGESVDEGIEVIEDNENIVVEDICVTTTEPERSYVPEESLIEKPLETRISEPQKNFATESPEPVKLATPEPEKSWSAEPVKLATPEPDKVLTPEPVKLTTPGPVKLATPEPEKALTPEPVKLATPEPEKVLTPEPVQLATPEPEKVLTPEPVKLATPEPEKVLTPEPVKLATPEPEKVLTPEPADLAPPEPENALTPESVKPEEVPTLEPVKSETPEPEKSVTPEPLKLGTPEAEKIELVGLTASETPETIKSNSLKTETEINAMLDDEKDSSSEDVKVQLEEYVEDLIPNLHEAKTPDLMIVLSSDTPKAKTPEPATESIKIAANEPKLNICEDDVEFIEFNEENKNSVTQDGAGGAAGLKDLLS